MKLRNSVWILILLILSTPVSYIYLIVHDNMLVLEEYLLNLIAGSFGTILVFGTTSFITYRILKSKQTKDPAKIALIVYSVLLFYIFIISIFQYNEALIHIEHSQSLF